MRARPIGGGVMMWRGITRGPNFLGGRTMAMAGRRDCKFVCYPIQEFDDGTCLINWIADRAMPPDYVWREQDWNRAGRLEDFLDAFAGWSFDWLDVPKIITTARASGNIRWWTATRCRAGATGG